MRLSDFMRERRLRDRAMGEMVGLSESQISRIRRGKSVPQNEKMKEFMRVTEGLVTPNDFICTDRDFTSSAESGISA